MTIDTYIEYLKLKTKLQKKIIKPSQKCCLEFLPKLPKNKDKAKCYKTTNFSRPKYA